MIQVNATLINLFHVCHRETWLHANGIRMEHTSETVAMGKFIHENSYPQRSEQFTELRIGNSQIDYFDPVRKIVHEIKKSDKAEEAHEWQVKYYLYLLETEAGINEATAILEYPTLRKRKEIILTDSDRHYLRAVVLKIQDIITSATCPPVINQAICKTCSYADFCYAGE